MTELVSLKQFHDVAIVTRDRRDEPPISCHSLFLAAGMAQRYCSGILILYPKIHSRVGMSKFRFFVFVRKISEFSFFLVSSCI
jgi:hypothetical protein